MHTTQYCRLLSTGAVFRWPVFIALFRRTDVEMSAINFLHNQSMARHARVSTTKSLVRLILFC